jgi:hypothetical protein
MLGITRLFPSYLQGLGDDTEPAWITNILKPIADTVKQYFDTQTIQQTALTQTQQSSLTGIKSISPIYLIAGGVVMWYIFRGKKKGRNKR